MVDEASSNEETSVKEEPKQKPPFEVPLQELQRGKAGVEDLFNKTNEVIKYLNALKQKPQVP